MLTRAAADRLIVGGAGVVIVALTAAAFWLSYAHLADIAAAHGLTGARAWAWPATLDLGVIAGELLMLRAALQGRVDWWAIGLTVASAGGSIALNVAGVGGHAAALDYVVAAVPPSAALVAFGVMMRQVHRWLAHHPPAAVAGGVPARGGVVICDRGGVGIPAVPAAPRVATAGAAATPQPRSAGKPAARARNGGRRLSDAELLAAAREITADWTPEKLTAERIRTALHIAPGRARALREALRAERSQPGPVPVPVPDLPVVAEPAGVAA